MGRGRKWPAIETVPLPATRSPDPLRIVGDNLPGRNGSHAARSAFDELRGSVRQGSRGASTDTRKRAGEIGSARNAIR